MAKQPAKNEPAPPKELSRKHRRLQQQEQVRQRWLLIGVGLVVGLALIVLLAGQINESVVKPRRAIALVQGEPISVAAFQRRLRFAQDNTASQINQYIQFGEQFASAGSGNPFAQSIQQLAADLSAPETMSLTVLDDMIREQFVQQLAAAQGLSVTEDEVQQEVEKQFGYERNPTPTPTPDPTITNTNPVSATVMTADEFQQNYQDAIKRFADSRSLNEAEFRNLYRYQLLNQRLQDTAPLDVQSSEEQVHARHILVRLLEVGADRTQEQAEVEALTKIKAIRERIVKGEKFEDVAAEVSDDTSNKDKGGDLDWFGRGQMVTEFEDVAFSLEPGVLSEPVKTSFGYHLIEVIEKDANRPVEESLLEQRRSQAYQEWLQAQQDAASIERRWASNLVPALPNDIQVFLSQVGGLLAQPASQPAAATPEAPASTPAATGTPES